MMNIKKVVSRGPRMSSKNILLIACVLLAMPLCQSVYAFCERPPAKLCNVFFSNDLVVHAKVTKIETVYEGGDFVTGWLYHLQVLKTYRGRAGTSITVYSENTTARLLLQPGKEYIVFASRNEKGRYEAGNYCGEVQHDDGEPYSTKLEDRIRELISQKSSVIEGEVVDKNWNLISGVKLTVTGNDTREDVTVDKSGHFSITVAPGSYQVLLPKSLHVTDYSWSVADKDSDKIRPLYVVGGQCVQIQLQER